MRILARETGIGVDAQRKGDLSNAQPRELQTAARDLLTLPLYIDDQAGLNIEHPLPHPPAHAQAGSGACRDRLS